jgi:pimeloyl-ACP methyl ester carboxylesterase
LGQPISQHREVLSISLPGFGGSPEPAQSWGTWDYTALVRRYLVAQTNDPVDIIAHSFGGRIAVGLAARYPDLVRRLVLIASAGLRPPRSAKVRLKLLSGRIITRVASLTGGRLGRELLAGKQKLGSPDWQAASPVMRGTLSRVLREDLSRECRLVQAPTLLIWGEGDRDTPPILGRRMSVLIPHSELKILSGAGHYCFLDRPGEVLSLVWRHLALPSPW